MARKPFNRALFDKDDPAKNDFSDWLTRQGWKVAINPDLYGIDLLARSPDDRLWEIEIEVKHNWSGPVFPYTHLHYAERKKKFAHPQAIFVTFNHERSHVLAVSGPIVASSPIVVKETKYTTGEQFIEIPITSCKLIQILESD